MQAFHDAGWTRQEVINIPNALSMGRLLSGPIVAHLILQHQWPAAMVTLIIAGVSDWADGYAAKHWGQSSVLGSYLDPLADKVLVCCTVGALAAEVSSSTMSTSYSHHPQCTYLQGADIPQSRLIPPIG